jgi:hypothetical protein
MELTPAQIATIKDDILADPTMSAQPQNSDGSFEIARLYNLLASPDFFVWNSSTPANDIYDAINWANMTPADAADGTQLWLNRALACQGKQFNVQILLQGRDRINAAKANIQAGLQDCLLNYPSGQGGVARSAGWLNVRLAMQRKATRLEKLLATGGNGTNATPSTAVFEGTVSYQQIDVVRAS